MNLTYWQQVDGSVINAVGVLVGATLGLVFRNALPQRITQTIQSAIGLVTIFLGMRIAWQLSDLGSTTIPGIVIALVALTIGGGIGEALRLDDRLSTLAERVQRLVGRNDNNQFSEGLLAAFLIFCVGPVTILGSIDNGLRGDNQLLIIKTVLDTITAAALASSYGIGVLFSAVPLVILQGGISLLAGGFAQLIPDPSNNPLVLIATSSGGIILLGLGANLLQVTRVRIAALLPSLLLGPIIYAGLMAMGW
jgi:uncharacterized membrane protein YqgA involved in biofilm formation